MTKWIEVTHEGVEGTARVPETALKHMKGWAPVEETSTDDADGGPDQGPAEKPKTDSGANASGTDKTKGK